MTDKNVRKYLKNLRKRKNPAEDILKYFLDQGFMRHSAWDIADSIVKGRVPHITVAP